MTTAVETLAQAILDGRVSLHSPYIVSNLDNNRELYPVFNIHVEPEE